jgi:hypothetical protein
MELAAEPYGYGERQTAFALLLDAELAKEREAERERCARIAERWHCRCGLTFHPEDNYGAGCSCDAPNWWARFDPEEIAAAIRSGSPPAPDRAEAEAPDPIIERTIYEDGRPIGFKRMRQSAAHIEDLREEVRHLNGCCTTLEGFRRENGEMAKEAVRQRNEARARADAGEELARAVEAQLTLQVRHRSWADARKAVEAYHRSQP